MHLSEKIICTVTMVSDEVVCSGHEHLDIDVIESVYNFSVDKLFEMIFTDSQLYRHFTEVKKTKGRSSPYIYIYIYIYSRALL